MLPVFEPDKVQVLYNGEVVEVASRTEPYYRVPAELWHEAVARQRCEGCTSLKHRCRCAASKSRPNV